jgi:hypothetical protein
MATQSIAGYNGLFYVSPDGGTTWHLIGELTDVKAKITTKMEDATSHSSGGLGEFIPGNTTWTGTATVLSVFADVGQAAIAAALSPKTKLKFRFDPVGTAVGKPRREGFGYVSDFEETAPNSGLVGATITIQGTGALVISTQ